jgi:hypothetical protein
VGIFEFLQTPIGIEVAHAIIGLLVALTLYITYLAHERAKAADLKMDGHLHQHVRDAEMARALLEPLDDPLGGPPTQFRRKSTMSE